MLDLKFENYIKNRLLGANDLFDKPIAFNRYVDLENGIYMLHTGTSISDRFMIRKEYFVNGEIFSQTIIQSLNAYNMHALDFLDLGNDEYSVFGCGYENIYPPVD